MGDPEQMSVLAPPPSTRVQLVGNHVGNPAGRLGHYFNKEGLRMQAFQVRPEGFEPSTLGLRVPQKFLQIALLTC